MYLDHVCSDLKPELPEWESLCEGLAGCERHLQHGVMLLVPHHGILRHVYLDLAYSDQPVLVMAKVSCGLNLEHILLEVTGVPSDPFHVAP